MTEAEKTEYARQNKIGIDTVNKMLALASEIYPQNPDLVISCIGQDLQKKIQHIKAAELYMGPGTRFLVASFVTGIEHEVGEITYSFFTQLQNLFKEYGPAIQKNGMNKDFHGLQKIKAVSACYDKVMIEANRFYAEAGQISKPYYNEDGTYKKESDVTQKAQSIENIKLSAANFSRACLSYIDGKLNKEVLKNNSILMQVANSILEGLKSLPERLGFSKKQGLNEVKNQPKSLLFAAATTKTFVRAEKKLMDILDEKTEFQSPTPKV